MSSASPPASGSGRGSGWSVCWTGCSKKDAAISKALLLGDREDLPEETTGAFRASGIAHILAVSGLHVSILSLWLLFVLKALQLSPRLRFTVMVALLLAYCRLLDFAAPVVRSLCSAS